MRVGQLHHRSLGHVKLPFSPLWTTAPGPGARHAVVAIVDYDQREAIGFQDVTCAAGVAGRDVPIQQALEDNDGAAGTKDFA